MIDDVTPAQLLQHLVHGDARFHHQYHDMIHEIGNFVNRLLLIPGLSGNDDLSTLFPNLFQDLVQPLLKER